MRSLAVAMVIMGSLLTSIAIVLAFRGAGFASTVGILLPSVSLIVAGGIILTRNRE